VQTVLWGVCKITEKRKLDLRGKWTEPGRVLGLLYKGCRPFFFSFFHFLSLSSLPSPLKLSVLSPLLCSLSDEKVRGSGGGWPAGAAAPPRRHRRVGTLNYYFFNFFCLISSASFSYSTSTIKSSRKVSHAS